MNRANKIVEMLSEIKTKRETAMKNIELQIPNLGSSDISDNDKKVLGKSIKELIAYVEKLDTIKEQLKDELSLLRAPRVPTTKGPTRRGGKRSRKNKKSHKKHAKRTHAKRTKRARHTRKH